MNKQTNDTSFVFQLYRFNHNSSITIPTGSKNPRPIATIIHARQLSLTSPNNPLTEC